MRVISTNSGGDHSPMTVQRLLARLLLATLGFLTSVLAVAAASEVQRSAGAKSSEPLAQYAHLPLSFEPNMGQTDPRAKFLARGLGYTLFLGSDEAVLSMARNLTAPGASASVIRLKLLGADHRAAVSGSEPLPGLSNYFVGNDPKRWRTHVPNYAKVRYTGLYPGVDLIYYGQKGNLEYDFVVGPRSDAGRIRLGILGADQIALDAQGDLVLRAGGGEVRFKRPVAYQMSEGRRKSVRTQYRLDSPTQIAFELGAYDSRLPLVIDPVLLYATYLGGTGGDVAYGVAVDSQGTNTYVTGVTNSTDFPTATGARQTSNKGNGDAFVTKISSSGEQSGSTTTKLVYSTYLGGSQSDTATAIAVDAGGDAFVTGTTSSSDFPIVTKNTTTTVFQPAYGGNGDAFVAQMNSTGDALTYSTYLGGQGADAGQGIALDSSGNAYVIGSTQSNDFPLVTPFQPTAGGSTDAFVAEVSVDATKLLYSTYLGGSGADVGQAIAVNKNGNAYITGYTFSTNFPIQGPYQTANAGSADAFVAELKPDGSGLVFATYLGGSGDDRAFGIALDNSEDVYVAGATQSSNFPTASNVLQTTNHGASDAFVAKLNPAGANLVYSTYLGGSDIDQANAIAVDSSGNAFVTGFTRSSDFPTQAAVQGLLGISGGSACGSTICADAFVSELNSTGTVLTYSTFLGGSGLDIGQAVAVDTVGDTFVAGSTASPNFPAIYNASQSALAGTAGNAFVAEINPANNPGIAVVPDTLDFGSQPTGVPSTAKTVQVINEGTAPLNISSITSSVSYFNESNNCVGTVPANGGTCTISVTYTPTSTGASAAETISITDNAVNSPQLINLKGTGAEAATAVTFSPVSLTFGNQAVGTVSAPQTVTLTNTGTATLNITNVAVNADYAETDNCNGHTVNVGDGCSITVVFQPQGSGPRNGSLSVTDNASGSPQSVALAGTGVAQFSLSSPSPTATITVGSTTGCPSGLTASCAAFKIAATATTSSFNGAITLACGSSAITCTFNPGNPATILPGQTNTLTVSNISPTTQNPLNFTVNGTSGAQTYTLNLTLLQADFKLGISPAINTVVAGSPAGYKVLVTPLYGFSGQVNLSCASNGLPPGSTCTFDSGSVSPNGSPVSVNLNVNTTKGSSGWPHSPFRGGPPPDVWWFACLAVLAAAAYLWKRHREAFRGEPLSPRVRWSLASLTLGLMLLSGLSACRPSGVSATATTTGNYEITIIGTLNSNTTVARTAVVNLAVTALGTTTSSN